jgi:hypothetical protein
MSATGDSGAVEESGQLLQEEEEYLQRALNAKRQLAVEILEASLRAGELGDDTVRELVSLFVD